VFACVGFVVLCGAVWIELHDHYLIHVEAAIDALDQERCDAAAQEVKVALAMRPESPLAKSLVREIDEQKSFRNPCDALPVGPNAHRAAFDLCTEMQCDGKLHTLDAKDSSRILYVGTNIDGVPETVNGVLEKEVDTLVVMEALGDFDEDVCAVSWERTSRIRLDAHGSPIGKPFSLTEKTSTLTEFDPRLIRMEKQSGISKASK